MARMSDRGHIRPKFRFNVGMGLDLVTGTFLTGSRGESILNGGLPNFMSTAGPTNNFKTWFTDHWNLTAVNRLRSSMDTYYDKYDTEMNVNIDNQNDLGKHYPNLDDDLVFGTNQTLSLTDKVNKKGDIWKSDFINFTKEQCKEKEIVYEGLRDPYSKGQLKLLPSVLFSIDTLTELTTTAIETNVEKYKKDDGSDLTDNMKKGLFRAGLLEILPEYLVRGNSYLTLVAQVAEGIDMGGKFSPKPMKKLQYLKDVDKIKGVPRQFYSLTALGLLFHNAKNLLNSDKSDILYPSKKKKYLKEDLNVVMCTVLRNKLGNDGMTLFFLISKTDGPLDILSAYHTIKDKNIGNNFGISGNDRSFHLDLLPETTLTRTTVRDLIDDDKLVSKAVEFTRDMFQLSLYKPNLILMGLLPSPAVLRKDIEALGYDWNVLLNTTSYYVPNHYREDRLYLSVMCLLDIRQGTYHPYWLAEDKKTVLPISKWRKGK